jgi:hypothetical protein
MLILIHNEMNQQPVLRSSCLISLSKIISINPSVSESIFTSLKIQEEAEEEEEIYLFHLLIFISHLIPILQMERRFSFILFSSLESTSLNIKRLTLKLLGNLFLKRKLQIENIHFLFVTLLDEELNSVPVLTSIFHQFQDHHGILLNIFNVEKNPKIFQILYQSVLPPLLVIWSKV